MRILLVGTHHRAEIRGAHVAVHGLARTLRDRGHDVTLLQAADPRHQREIRGIRCVYADRDRKSAYPVLFALRRLSGYDLIHANDNGAAFLALRARVSGPPLVAQFNPPSVHPESFLRAGWRWRYINLAARAARTIVTPSRWLGEALRERFGLDPARMHVVPYGVGEHWFRAERADAGRRGGPPRVVLVNMKGVEVALAAFAKVAPSHAARLELYGSHPESRRFRALASELGLEERVDFVGWVPNDELPGRLAGADVLLNPTRADNLPQVLLETAALGIPAVTTAVGGTPEIVLDGETGLLCPGAETVDAFAAGLDRLLSDEVLRARMGRAARERAVARWRWDAVAEQLEREVYGKLL